MWVRDEHDPNGAKARWRDRRLRGQRNRSGALDFDPDEIEKIVTVFTDASVDFSGQVRPGERVTTTGRVKFFRRKKLRAEVEMRLDTGQVVCSGVLSGMGVPR